MRIEDIEIPREHRVEALFVFVAIVVAMLTMGYAAGYYVMRGHVIAQVVPIAELAKVGFKGSFGECETDARPRWTTVTLETAPQ